MAKSFLKYGTAKGLGKSIDYTSIINQRLQNEQLLNQSKLRAEQRAEHIAEKMNPYETDIPWITERVNKNNDDVREEMSSYLKKNPNYRYSVDGQMEFNKISSKMLDNEWVKIDQTSKENYAAFQKAMPNLTNKQIKREQEKYRQYYENEQVTPGPYVFDASVPYNLTEMAMEGAKLVDVDFDSDNYSQIQAVAKEKLTTGAQLTYIANKDDWDDAWDNFSGKSIYGGNQMKWIEEIIRAQKSEGKQTNYAALASLARTNAAKGAAMPVDYHASHIEKQDINSDNRVTNGWLFATRSNTTDPNKGGYLNDPDEIFIMDANGIPFPVGKEFGFDNVKLTNAHKAYQLPSEMRAANGGYNEFMEVTAEIDWNTSNLNNLDTEELKAYAKKMGLRPADEDPDWMQLLLADSLTGDLQTDELNANRSFINELKKADKYIAKFYVPIDRYSKRSKDYYNDWFSSQKNTLEVSQQNPLTNTLNIAWDTGVIGNE